MSDDRDNGGMPPRGAGDEAPPPPPPSSLGGYGDANQPPSAPGSGWNQPADTSGGYYDSPAAPQSGGGWGAEQYTGAQPAGLGLRIVAYIIDALIIGVVTVILGAIVGAIFLTGGALSPDGMIGGGGFEVSFISGLISAALTLAYFGLLEGNGGQTLAKRLLSIRAVRADGRPLEVGDAVKRRIPFVIGAVIPIPILGPLVSLGLAIAIIVTAAQDRPYNRGLHDKWADTMVMRA